MADFSTGSRFAVAITADDKTAEGAQKSERTIANSLDRTSRAIKDSGTKAGDAVGGTLTGAFAKSSKAAVLASSETAKAMEKGLGRSLDQAKKKTDAADKSLRTLRDRVAARWHTSGMGKAFEGVTGARMATGELAGTFGGAFAPAAGLAALLSGGGLVDLLSHFGSRTNEISRVSSRYGVPPEMLQQWRGAAKVAGVDPNAVTSSLGALTGHQYDFRHNRPEAADVYQTAVSVKGRTGVDLVGALWKDQATFLRTLSKAMPKLEVGAQPLVAEAFGVGGLLDVLRDPAKLDRLLDSMRRLGTLNKDQVEQGDALYASFQLADLATGHFADTIEGRLTPTFKPLLDSYTDWTTDLSKNKSAVDDATAGVEGLAAVFGLTLVKAIGKAARALLDFNKIGSLPLLPITLPLTLKGDTPGADVPGGRGSPEQQEQIRHDVLDWNKAHPNQQVPVPPKSVLPGSGSLTTPVEPVVPPKAPAPGAGLGALSNLIGRGEGGYNSVNRGAGGGYQSGTEDLASMTLDQVMAAQRAGKFNAAGKYQITKNTLSGAAEDLQLTGREKFDRALQDRIFAQYLVGDKRPAIRDYLAGRSDDLRGAARAAAEEWASIADPDTGRTRYPGHNRASISPAEIEDALESARMQREARRGRADDRAPFDADAGTNRQPRRQPAMAPDLGLVDMQNFEPVNLNDLVDYEPGERRRGRGGDNSQEIVILVKAPNGYEASIGSKKGPSRVTLRRERIFTSA